MLIAEAEWIGRELAGLPDDAFPLINVGCQTEAFRTEVQPWIEEHVFGPVGRRGRAVVNVDLRDEPGVDVVADVTTTAGQDAVRAAGGSTVLCANVLEHVPDPRSVLDGLMAAVPPGGYLLLSGPRAFPYHPDPIDTMFRPSWEEAAGMLGPDFEVLQGADVQCRRMAYYYGLRPWGRLRLAARLVTPFVRPAQWRERVAWTPRHASAYVLLARRKS
jgi:hypothetical protein